MTKKEPKNKKITDILKDNQFGIRLDLGCGENKQKNFVGIDCRKLDGVDIVHDLEVFPYPLPDGCASLAIASHLVEHINPHRGVFINFMNEIWGLLKPDGEFLIACPYAGSPGFFQDPTHVNNINEITWEYFDPIAPVTKGGLYQIYKPKPWKIKTGTCVWQTNGNLEVVMIKRREDKSYK